MTNTTIFILIFLLSIIGSFIQRVSGFGFGVFVMMFFPFILPSFGASVTLSGMLSLTFSLILVLKNMKNICWKQIWLLIVVNVVVSCIGISFMSGMGNDMLKKGLGLVLILIALYSLLFDGKLHISPESKWVQAIIGALSGITGGMFAMPGPPVVLYCIEAFHDKKEYIASIQTVFLISNCFYLIFRIKAGFFTTNLIGLWAIGLIGVGLGIFVGAKLFNKISGTMLRKIVYSMMLLSGVIAMV